LLLALLAATWALASLGVFIRDIGQIVNVFMSMLMFLSQIFFPASALLTWPLEISPR
jgi:lipopolysaccharide transport system permease protein